MKRVEIEAFLKGFMLFFLSMGTVISMVIYNTYKSDIEALDDKLLDQMRICNFDLKCKEFTIDFATDENFTLFKLYKEDSIHAYFPIPSSQKNLLIISLSKVDYNKKIESIRWNVLREFISIIIIITLFSVLFSLYTLSPLRRSLRVTEEFIKDILHDFNTPLSTLRLNGSMLKREIGDNKKIRRMESSIESILSLQENLRCYLFDHQMQQDFFGLKEFIQDSINAIEKSYPYISYSIDISNSIKIKSNQKAFRRIIDNLLSNASKYNKADGTVKISYKDRCLTIEDTGKGIKETKKIFERFYKEQDRGIGVGLHIVKKLCDELKISIEVKSKVGIGSQFILSLKEDIL